MVFFHRNCRSRFGCQQGIKQWQLSGGNGMFGIEEHGSRPCLVGVAHGVTAFPVHPLVELPRRMQPLLVGSCQAHQQPLRFLLPVMADQRSHVEPAHHRPDAAIVVLMGQVQVPAAVVFPPGGFAGENGRVDRLGGVGFRHAHLQHVAQDMLGAMPVGNPGEDGKQVSQAVAPVAVFPECHPRQVEGAAGDGADIVIQHEPFQPDGFQFLKVLGKVGSHPATVHPQQQVQPFMDGFGAGMAGQIQREGGNLPRHLLVCQCCSIIQHIIVQRVVADGNQVHPVARLRDLQQTALVHILVLQPGERLADALPVLLQCLGIAAGLIQGVLSQDIPQVGVT